MEKSNFENPPRVLVANADRDAADVCCLLLHAAGYRVQRAYDGLTALTLAKVTKPDAAILDFSLPGLTGLQVLRELHAEGGKTKVLIVSGSPAFQELDTLCLRAGARACVQRPFTAGLLLELLARVLARPRRSGAGQAP